MKKILIMLALIAFPLSVFGASHFPNGITVGTIDQETDSGYTVGAGDLLVNDDLFSGSGLINMKLDWENLAAADTDSLKAVSRSTGTLLAGASTWLLASSDYTDIIMPRNIVIVDYTVNTGTLTVTASYAIVGTNHRGDTTTETISVSTTTGTTATGTGVVAWASITSITGTYTVASSSGAGNVRTVVGSGNKIGLLNDITASGDVKKVIEDGATSTTATINTTYDTIDFATDANATYDYSVIYAPKAK
ncbi:MAG: hypothetical protein WCY09_08005 [Candidatus Omnitrophota bacterium]